jgi:hypothetical protein
MDEKILKEIIRALDEIKAKLDIPRAPMGDLVSHFRGPIADPAPPWLEHFRTHEVPSWVRVQWAADPAVGMLLDRRRLAQLKIHQIENMIEEMERQIGLLKLVKDLLEEEYK